MVDAAGNVREGAGGVSADFKLMRNVPVNAYIIHDFNDFGLHMDGKRPDTVDYDFTMPPSIATYFTNAYLVGAFWRNPNFSLNGSGTSPVGATDWALAVRALNKNFLVPGLNRITFSYTCLLYTSRCV